MLVVPEALTLDGALPVVLTAGFEEPVGLPVPGEAGGTFDPAGAWLVDWAIVALEASMATADITISLRKVSSVIVGSAT